MKRFIRSRPRVASRVRRISARTRRISARGRTVLSFARKASRSKTITRTKQTFRKLKQAPNGMVSNSFTIIPQKGNARFNKALIKQNHIYQTMNYVNQDTFRFTQGSGYQAVSNDDYTSGNGYGIPLVSGVCGNQIHDLPYKVYPQYTFATGEPSANQGVSSARMLVTNASQKLTMTNNTNATCEIAIYDILSRRDADLVDTESSPEKAWYIYGRNADPDIAPSTRGHLNTVGATPFGITAWCSAFKVVKVTKTYLTPGQTHIHTQKSHVNHIFDMSNLFERKNLAYKTSFCMVVVKGMPGTANDSTTVSTLPVEVVCVREVKYDIKLIAQHRDINWTVNNLSTIAAPYVVTDHTIAAFNDI